MEKKLFRLSASIRYRFPVKKGGKILVLAPHPDDEAIGCAGSLFSLEQKDVVITVVLFTQPKEETESENRLAEFKKATKFLGCVKLIELKYPDGDLGTYYESAKERLEKIVYDEEPDIIFTPYILDYHNDHKCVSEMLTEIVKEKEVLIAMYEVWVPILHPNYYIDISDYWEKKHKVLTLYKSQEAQYSIIQKASMLNQLRAQLSMRKNVTYIEAFRVFHGDEFSGLMNSIKENTKEKGEMDEESSIF